MESLEIDLQSEVSEAGPLDEQSMRLVASLETLFHRMMLSPQSPDRPSFEVTKEEVRAMIVLSLRSEITMSDLAEALAVPLSTATHTVDKLVSKDLALRTRSEQDRRLVLVTMSENGRKFQEALRAKHKSTARSWLGPLTPGEREIFLELMAKITRLAQL
jgi:DNA-binding MarR family transcriptional regulator